MRYISFQCTEVILGSLQLTLQGFIAYLNCLNGGVVHLGSVWFLVTSHLQESLFTQFLQQVPHIFTNVVGYAVFVLDDLFQFIRYGLVRLVGVLLHFANRFPRRFLGLRLHTEQLGQYTMRSLS